MSLVFKSPLPNPKIWQPQTVSRLQNQDVFVNGGWWHDERVLQATGDGIEVEEARGWSSWWNEQIVRLSLNPVHGFIGQELILGG